MKTYYDIHCHVFNKDVVIRKLVNVVQSLVAIRDLLENEFSEEDLRLKIEGITNTLNKVTHETSEEVFLELNKEYKGTVVVTPLMFDLTFADDNDDDENRDRQYRRKIAWTFRLVKWLIPILKLKIKNKELRKALNPVRDGIKEFEKKFKVNSNSEVEIFNNNNFIQQIEDLENLSIKYDTVKPFFSIDPRREYKAKARMKSLTEEKILQNDSKFFGIKLYAPAGFSPTDPVLMDDKNGIYALCQKHKIPITVHNSNAGFACLSEELLINGHINLNGEVKYVENYRHEFEYDFFSRKAGEAIKERAKLLNHPKIWKLVLEKYPNLVINFAHFGGSGQIMEYIEYALPKQIEVDIFEKSLAHLSDADKTLIETMYARKRKYLFLIQAKTTDKRAKIWNMMNQAGLIDNWAKAIFEIVRNKAYPNAFTDLSCFSEGEMINLPDDDKDVPVFTIKHKLKTFKRDFFDEISTYEKSKILYGSDFFLAQFFGPTMKQYFSDFKEAFKTDFDKIAIDNPKRFLNIKN